MQNLPSFKSYGNYSSGNYGAHCLQFSVNGLTVYFSYSTLVAFHGKYGLVVRQNDWGPTTGKHLNWINRDKASRIDGVEFEKQLMEETASRE